MNNKSTGIGIIGFDHWYWAYSAAYTVMVNPQVRLVGIWSEDEEEARKLASRYKAKKRYGDYHKLLENPEIDAVMIFTTTNQHSKIAIEAINTGKHLLVNKPIARTLKEADKIIEEAKRANVKLMAIGAADFINDFPEDLLEENVGFPVVIHYSLRAAGPQCRPHLSDPGWFADPQKAAGGAFIDHACYMVGALRSYLDSEVESVYGDMQRFLHKEWKIEDYGVSILHLKNGIVAIIESTFTGQSRYPVRVMITGTKGEAEITWVPQGREVTIWSMGEPKRRYILPSRVFVPDETYLEPMCVAPPGLNFFKPTIDEFLESFTEDKRIVQTAEGARANLEVCLAAYESFATRRPVHLPLKEQVDVASIVASL